MIKTICIAGKNDIAVNVLKFCKEKYEKKGIQILCILTRGDNGINGWQKSLKWFCEQNDVKIISYEESFDIEDMIFLSVEFDRILKTEKFKTDKIFNIHFSLLPEYKGMYPSVLPLLHGKSETGVTLHKIRNGIDTGEIIAQRKFAINDEDTSLAVYEKLIKYGTELVIENVDNLINDNYEMKVQSSYKSTYYSPDVIDYKNLSLNTRRTAYQIDLQVRAFAFRPYQLLKYEGIGIISCKITDEISSAKIGEVIEETDTYFKMSTIDYNILLYKDVLNELLDAIREHDNKRAKELCVAPKIISEKNNKGWTPLIVATYFNNQEMVEFLIDNGADVNVVNYNGTNLLMYAKDAYIRTGDNSLFKYYRAKGISEYKKDYAGKNLLQYIEEAEIRMEDLLA